MRNNILGFVVYLLTAILFSPSTSLILLALKENADRCHYYNGKWNKTDIIIGCGAVAVGVAAKYLLFNYLNIELL